LYSAYKSKESLGASLGAKPCAEVRQKSNLWRLRLGEEKKKKEEQTTA